MCAQAAAAAQTGGKKNKGKGVQLNFTELDDIFLSTKGRALRNLKKKMDKVKELEKSVKKGQVEPNEQ